MQTSKIKLTVVVAACVLTACPMANAALSWSGSVGGAPTGVTRVNFDSLTLGGAGGTLGPLGNEVNVSFTPDAKAVTGSVANQYAAPVLSGNNGIGFGSPNQANGADATVYLTSGKDFSPNVGASVTLTFNSLQQYFGLLWGSIDGYNTLTFYNGATSVGSVTGSQVLAGANGNQGVNGTLYVNINSTSQFDRVVATSSEYAFEFDNVAYNATPVPEPATMIAGALLLLPFGASTIRFIRKSRAA